MPPPGKKYSLMSEETALSEVGESAALFTASELSMALLTFSGISRIVVG
jgi:hypothetical protein